VSILYYTPFYLPQSNAAAVRAYWNVQALKSAGHEVQIISSVDSQEIFKLSFNPADNKQSFLKRLVFEFLAGAELFFRIIFSKCDLYVLSSPPFITVSMAHLACRIKNRPYVLDIRDIYPDVYFAQKLIRENSVIGSLVKNFTRSMYEHSAGVLSVTPGLIQKIQNLAPKTAEVLLLINGYDEELFKISDQKYEKFTVMFHGNMGKVQNLETILKVAENLKNHTDIEFVFIGDGPQAELIKNSSLDNLKFLGSQNYELIPDLISKAHVGFSARRDDDIGSDALPVKAFEYLGVGIPVILTPSSGILSKLVSEGVYEFSNTQIEAISQKILEIKVKKEIVTAPRDLSRQKVSRRILDLRYFQ
jgi:colanic acid biosynthesis glycosyl transferase WcaI